MTQCNAATAKGTQCMFPVTPPSRTLCGKHLNAIARGSVVTSALTGRKFPVSRG